MLNEPNFHPHAVKHQRVMATICIVVLSIAYLAGYVQLHKMISLPQRSVASTQLMQQLRPPIEPASLAFAPDVPTPVPQGGLAPLVFTIPTKQPVVFLTIDDGVYREPEAAAKMRAARVPASLFLVQRYVSAAPGYFSYVAQQTGSAIEDHTLDHKDLRDLNYKDQRNEICTTADIYKQVYGKRPTLLRPPYGDYNEDTRRAAASCGLSAVVLWHALVQDGAMQYQVGNTLRPGDIVLMHFTPAFKKDLQAFLDASKAAGLTPQLLEDWLTY